jgi:hypothetical protein
LRIAFLVASPIVPSDGHDNLANAGYSLIVAQLSIPAQCGSGGLRQPMQTDETKRGDGAAGED